MSRAVSFACFAIVASLFYACSTTLPVEKAFSGDLKPAEESKAITDYCQSCHNHRGFLAGDHIAKVPGHYSKEPYKSATSCKVCHGIERNVWDDIIRFTHIPDGRIVND